MTHKDGGEVPIARGWQTERERQADYMDRRATGKFTRWERFLIRRARSPMSRLASILLCYAYERDVIDSQQLHILADSFNKALYPERRAERQDWS